MWLIIFIGACGDTPVDCGRGLSGIISSQRALWFAVLHSWRVEASINKNMNLICSSLPAWVSLLEVIPYIHVQYETEKDRICDITSSTKPRFISDTYPDVHVSVNWRNQTPDVFESVSKSESWAAAERLTFTLKQWLLALNQLHRDKWRRARTAELCLHVAVKILSPHNDCWTQSTRRSGCVKCKCSAMGAGWRAELWLENAQRSNLFISWFQRRLIEAASSDFLYVTVQHTQKRKQSNRETEIQADTRETVHSAQSHCFPSEFSACQRHE